MSIQSLKDMFITANDYLERHEEDNDRDEQDETMRTILIIGFATGFAAGIGSAIVFALVKGFSRR